LRTLEDWLAYQQRLHPQSIDLGLERVRAVAQRLGLLPLRERSAIVGGTNGKGSTASFLAALGSAHGVRTGLFTSPHLVNYEERIAVDAEPAAAAAICAAFERIEAARDGVSLTYFEFNALAALFVFREAGVGLAVLEVGLGGRLDATNIVDADVAVLCSVSFDHQEWLGDTLEQIGAEKAGIFRARQHVVLGHADMPASVGDAVRRLGCRAEVAGEGFRWRRHADGSWDFLHPQGDLRQLPPPALPGEVQYRNAATALAAFIDLLPAVPLAAPAVRVALEGVRLPGRLQRQAGPVEWWFDVAHNPAAAAVLAAELAATPVPGRTWMLLGMLADKDAAAVARCLEPQADGWVLCTPEGERALAAQALLERIAPLAAPVEARGDVADACARVTELARPGDRVVACGSFHTAGPALRWRGLYSRA
jgi:dihydrofolate synthase/folylpolyglutamate synthase